MLRIIAPMTLEMFAMSSDLEAAQAFAAEPRSDREMEMELSICKMVTDSRREENRSWRLFVSAGLSSRP